MSDFGKDINVHSKDVIYKQDAINLLKKWADGYKYIETETELAIKEFEQLPSVQLERWIPVSERLPEEKEIVLITFDERVEMGRMCGESWEWLFESGWDYWIDIDNVTAWMPMPEPYKEED